MHVEKHPFVLTVWKLARNTREILPNFRFSKMRRSSSEEGQSDDDDDDNIELNNSSGFCA